jgi:choline dehydrogenase-like flavoprotein
MGSFDCDVVIVGAGISGALLAWKLGSMGVKVIVLEGGPGPLALTDRQGFVDTYKETGTPYPFNKPSLKEVDFFSNQSNYFVEKPDTRPQQGPVPVDPSDKFGQYSIINDLTAKGDWFQSNYERQSGGSTWHWLGTSLRLLPADFKLKSTYNPTFPNPSDPQHPFTAYDWPFGYDDIEPWYSAAEHTIGVSGPDTGETYLGLTRSSNYPMPGIPQSYSDQQVAAAIQGQQFVDPWVNNQNFPLLVSPTPQARNSTPGFGGRPQCQGSTSCIPICPIQAKYDATQHIAMASQMSNVEFRTQSVAYQVSVDTTTPAHPISGIKYKTWSGDPNNPTVTNGTVTGSIYVLSSHAVENAKLLLNSSWGESGMTVANSSTQVGKNLADHPVSLVYALTDQPVYGYRGPLSTSGVESLRDGPFRQFRGAFRMEIGNDGWSWPINDPYVTPQNLMSVDGKVQGRYGQDLATAVAKTLTRQIRIGCLAEQLPNPDFRVQLSSTLDIIGIPQPQLTYGIDAYGRRSLSAAVAASVQIFKQMIATPVVQYNYSDWTNNGALIVDPGRSDKGTPNIFVREGWAGAGHLMGTHRMGTKDQAGTSVVDGEQRSHDHQNLFLLGSGNWPSYATGNPTLTIAALALWAADTISTQLKQMT